MNGTIDLPPPMFAERMDESRSMPTPRCQEKVVEVAHVTGAGDEFLVLTERAAEMLRKETDFVDRLMEKFRQLIADAPDDSPCQADGEAGREGCACLACVQYRWMREAGEAGLLSFVPTTQRTGPEEIRLETEQDIQGRLGDLKKQRSQFQDLCGWWSDDLSCHISARMTRTLDTEIAALETRLAARAQEASPIATDTRPETGQHGARTGASAGYIQTRSGNGVTEITFLGRPDRRYYIRRRYYDELRGQALIVNCGHLRANRPLTAQELKQRGLRMLQDIREQIARGSNEARAKPLSQLEARLTSWTSPEDNLLNTLHRELSWHFGDLDAPYALDAEGHLLRFAAQASAGFSGFDPQQGRISLGVRGQASFALAEGKVGAALHIPSQRGLDCYFDYLNANGERVYHRFGAFRLRAVAELSCFVGVTASGEASTTTKWKDAPSGASALLSPPHLDARRGGAVTLKGDLFGGAQAGGSLTGALEWMHPEDQHRDGADWSALLSVGVEGNLALGAGIGGDFQIRLARNELHFHMKARLVWGPGASGGFAAMVDLDRAADLVVVVYRQLSQVDFHHLLYIDKLAFQFFYRSVLRALCAPRQPLLVQAIRLGAAAIQEWWNNREARIEATTELANNILNHGGLAGHSLHLSLGELPPEVLGPTLFLLNDRYLGSPHSTLWEEAIIELLGHIGSWRQFYLTLERMHPDAEIVSARESLDCLRKFLTRPQLQQFEGWIRQLGSQVRLHPGQRLAGNPWNRVLHDKSDQLQIARQTWRHTYGDDSRYA
ncbi:hypothetical protein [Zestomonas carbonaria]|uniref:Uncharacterized protein n=1 Tax=Zestomonas carbonaria TaxID=2762745 RepID=A0A7U7ETB3_9GAMM|nr:hypothetical protein [Pseudomonas carbonaria]CAD5110563.1 hypothetical protein PSEWESI4_04886 [Pseudomonas carbonaria]